MGGKVPRWNERGEAREMMDRVFSDVWRGAQDKLKDLDKEMAKLNDDDTPLTRNIRTLENRLDKAMIKYNEAQSIRKTYEQIVKRLKEERIGFDNQLAAIERTLKAKEKDLEELVLMSHDAQHAKEVAKAELLKLEHQLMEEKKQREKELADRRALVQQKVEMNQRMEKRDKMRREMALVEGGEQSDAGEANMKKSLFSTAFHSALNEHVLEEEQKKITTYEVGFRCDGISAALSHMSIGAQSQNITHTHTPE